MSPHPLLGPIAAVAGGLPVYWWLAPRHRGWALAGIGLAALGPMAPGATLGVAAATLALWVWLGDAPTRAAAWAAGAALVATLAAWKIGVEWAPGVAGVAAPLGLSFVVFRLIDWVIQRRRGALAAQPLGELLGWILMPWTFSAGPIETIGHHQRQRSDAWGRDHLVAGGARIAVGLVKKLVLADAVIAQIRREAAGDPGAIALSLFERDLSTGHAWLFASLSFLHLYVDFSAYSDLAIGTGRLFGLRITENFRWPLLASSPPDFWRRWHISLAEWCRAHVYLPALGLTRSPTLAVGATFLVMGLWHAPALPWVMWGLWHAAFLAGAVRWRRSRRGRPPLPRWAGLVAVPLTLAYATMGHALAALHGAAGPWAGLGLLLRMVGLYLPWPPS